ATDAGVRAEIRNRQMPLLGIDELLSVDCGAAKEIAAMLGGVVAIVFQNGDCAVEIAGFVDGLWIVRGATNKPINTADRSKANEAQRSPEPKSLPPCWIGDRSGKFQYKN